MRFYKNAGDALKGYNEAMSEAISFAIRTLLETKHLYQSVIVDEDGARQAFVPRIESNIKSHLLETGSLGLSPAAVPWFLSDDTNSQLKASTKYFTFKPSHAKLFCQTCDRAEAFNLDFVYPLIELTNFQRPYEKIEQVYSLGYVCQSCKTFPETFLVRRVGGKLTLVGRTPMEHVPVPPAIPKTIEKFYSGAIVAHQSGQTLAGLFLMRTACEQWARKWALPTDKADAAIDKYMAALPDDFKARFPSLRDMYSDLSADVHSATGSTELFEHVARDLTKHFDARRLYELKDSP